MYVVPCISPGFVMRNNMRLGGTVSYAFQRALKLSNGWTPKWVDEPNVIKVKPTLAEVERTLKGMHGRPVAWDVETDGRHPLQCSLRCIAFYDGHKAITVPLLYRTGVKDIITGKAEWKRYWGVAEERRIIAALKALFLASPSLRTQNGQFDRMVVKSNLGIDVPGGRPHIDKLIGHHHVAPNQPPKHGFLEARNTHSPHYKATSTGEAWSADSDHELWLYNSRDCITTWLISEKMEQELLELEQHAAIYDHDSWQEGQCQRWRETGIKIDLHALAYFRQHYQGIAVKALAAMRAVVLCHLKEGDPELDELLEKLKVKAKKKGKKEEDAWDEEDDDSIDQMDADGSGKVADVFNPASLPQLRTLFHKLGIPLVEKTKTGALSTAKEILTGIRKDLLAQKVPADDDRIAFLDYLFAWRESSKVDSTYLRPEVLRDGRVHPSFSVHGPPTGRLTSQNPNFQNQPPAIRGMYVADDEHYLCSGDADALELRLGAYNSQDPNYIEVFKQYDAKTGPKPHHANMAVIFGLPPTKEAADKNPGMYVASKMFAYAVAYGAGDPKIYDNVREEMPDLDFKVFKVAIANYRKRYARLFQFQREVVQQGTQKGYLDSGLLRRRTYFFERVFDEHSPEATAMQNFPYQSTGADVVSLGNRRMMKEVINPMRKKLLCRGAKWKDDEGKVHVLKFDERLEQVAQVHDELLWLIPKRLKKEFEAAFKKCIEVELKPGWYIPWDIKSKARWKPVQTRCGTVPKVKKAKKGGVAVLPTPCRELVDIEMTAPHVWEGKCSCGAAVKVVVDPKFLQEKEAA